MKCLTIFIFISLMFAGLSYGEIDEESIIGMWLFDDGGGDVAEDSSGNGYNGNLVNGPKWVKGKFGDALEFSGAGDYVDTELNTDDLSSPITICLWMNPTIVAKSALVSGYNNADPNSNRWDFQFARSGAGAVRWVAHENKNGGAISTTLLQTDTWYHVAMVHDLPNSESKIYVNGVLENTNALTQELNTGRVVQFAEGDGDSYGGLLDEIAIFNVVLSEDDIVNIMGGLGGVLSVSDTGKLATTWANIKK